MKVLKHPIILITFFVATGIWAGYHLHLSHTITLGFAVTSLLIFAIAFVLSRRFFTQHPGFLVATCILSIAIGLVCQWLHYAPNNSDHYSHLTTDETPVLKGVISERLKPNEYAEKYYLRVTQLDKKAATGTLLVTLPKDSLYKPLHAGDVLVIVDTPQPIPKSLNPHQFDYADYMARQNVFHQVRLKDNYIRTGRDHTFDYYVDNLRQALIRSFGQYDLPAETLTMINALLFGQRQDMDKATTESYTNAGVVHILAISGLHFATLFYILNLLFKPVRRYTRKGRWWQLLIVLGLLWTFAFITGLSASVVRSVVMFSFIGIGTALNRNSNIFNSIAISMLVLLLAKPAFLFDVGFQLSYAAVFSIVWLQPLYSRLTASKYLTTKYAKETVVISLVAQVGVLPLSLYYFNQFPLLFLLANVIVVPLSTLILLVALLLLVLNFTAPSLGIWAAKLLEGMIWLMNSFIKWIATFDALVIKDIPFTFALNVALYGVIICCVLWMYKKTYQRTIAVLSSIILFYICYTATAVQSKQGNEFVILNNRNSTIMAIQDAAGIAVYSTDSLALQNSAVKNYNKGNFDKKLSLLPLPNVMWWNNRKILVLDSMATYPLNVRPDVLVLTSSPKINLDRLLTELKPQEVVADATNYKTYAQRWSLSCRKQGVPFHYTADKGFYSLHK